VKSETVSRFRSVVGNEVVVDSAYDPGPVDGDVCAVCAASLTAGFDDACADVADVSITGWCAAEAPSRTGAA